MIDDSHPYRPMFVEVAVEILRGICERAIVETQERDSRLGDLARMLHDTAILRILSEVVGNTIRVHTSESTEQRLFRWECRHCDQTYGVSISDWSFLTAERPEYLVVDTLNKTRYEHEQQCLDYMMWKSRQSAYPRGIR